MDRKIEIITIRIILYIIYMKFQISQRKCSIDNYILLHIALHIFLHIDSFLERIKVVIYRILPFCIINYSIVIDIPFSSSSQPSRSSLVTVVVQKNKPVPSF